MFKNNLRGAFIGVCCISVTMVSGLISKYNGECEDSDSSACNVEKPWPSMAKSSHEPKVLEDLHAIREELGDYCFMPKNVSEMDMLYCHYIVGDFSPDLFSFFVPCWGSVLMNITQELETRLESGNMGVIDEFLRYLEEFVNLAVNYSNSEFIGCELFGDFGLRKTFVDAIRVGISYGKSDLHCLTNEMSLYVAVILNEILNSTKLYEYDTILDVYIWIAELEEEFFKSNYLKEKIKNIIEEFRSKN
jgi:hypothetical protein